MAFNPVSWCLSDLCVPDIQAYLKEKDLILIPIGSIEQHGLHLPLVTDAAQGLEIARRAAAKARVLYTPVLWFGYSPHHLGRVGGDGAAGMPGPGAVPRSGARRTR